MEKHGNAKIEDVKEGEVGNKGRHLRCLVDSWLGIHVNEGITH